MDELKLNDLIYFIEDETIQAQKIVTRKLRDKILASGYLWTKDLDVAEQGLRDIFEKKIQEQLLKFTS